MSNPSEIKVVIVDDNRTIRALLRAVLERSGEVRVVGEASDPYEARDVIKATDPDVITLDVEMPRMNGLQFLEKIMRLRPMPVVMVSSRTTEKSEAAITALSLGAVDCIDVTRLHDDPMAQERVSMVVKVAARASVRSPRATTVAQNQSKERRHVWNGRIVVIGSSTGGVDALETVFASFPEDCPPTLVTQHMPAAFLESFASRLNAHFKPKVEIASEGAKIQPGKVLIAPGGGAHLVLGSPASKSVHLLEDAGTERHVPAVNQLFASAIPFGRNIVAVMLTGMGRDGAEAMLALREAGAETLIQSARTCVVDGMPGAARSLGAGTQDVDLQDMGSAILAACSTPDRRMQNA